MKTYILERSQDELKNLIKRGSKEILSSLRLAHPKALTSKELIDQTGVAEATVYSSLSTLKRENYIKEIGKVKSGPGRHRENAINIPTMKYLLEDGNHTMSREHHYKLSRGNVEYDAEFLRVSDRLLETINLAPSLEQLLLVARDIQSQIKNEEDKDFKKWAPFRGKEYLCPSCKINHELRDFLRAMLLRLLDKLETDERYSSVLTESEYVSSSISKERLSLKKLEPKKATESLVVRILSIEKDTSKDKYDLLGIIKNKTWVCAEIESTLVTDEMVPGSMVECFPNYMGVDTELDILYIGLSKRDNDSIKRIPEMRTFPNTQDVITDIGTIILESKGKGQIFNVEGIIIQNKFLNTDNNSNHEFTSSVLLRDSTGMIPLKLDSRYLNKFHEGDKILVIGAVVNELLSLTVGDYSSVTKTGSVIITERNSPYQNEVYNKHIEVNSKQSQHMVAIRLIDVILTKSETTAVLSIENEGEKDLRMHPYYSGFIAIQNKRQFIAHDFVYNESGWPSIPPGIEERLVVRFKAVGPTESIVSFRFEIDPKDEEFLIRFKFTVRIPP